MRSAPHARHFGLSREAFALSPDPHFLWSSPDHAEALAALEVGLRTRRGLMVLVAEVGMGKTTLLHALLSRLGDDEFRTAYLTNTRLPFEDLLRQALDDFGVEHGGSDRYALLGALNGFLARCAEDGTIPALVVDEAHDLDDETFENLRLLSNFDTFDTKLLQIVLVGQPELDDKLRQPNLRQVAERVGTRVNVNPFDRRRSIAYVKHRLARAGGTIDVFTTPALEYLVHRARGVPRRLNILCHNAMLSAWAQGAPRVGLGCALAAERERTGATLVRLSGPRARRGRVAGAALAGAVVAGSLAMLSGERSPSSPPPIAPVAGFASGIVGSASPAEAVADEPPPAPRPAVALSAHGDVVEAPPPDARRSDADPTDPSGVSRGVSGPRRGRAGKAELVGPPAPARRTATTGGTASARAGRSDSESEAASPRERSRVAREASKRGRSTDGRRASAAAVDPRAALCFMSRGPAPGSPA
ncbi:MAG: AAA family ATPase [Alphaproteobacteria bacterium]